MKFKNNSFAQIALALKKGKKFFIAGHRNPDGDCLGCMLALSSFLKRTGKRVYAFNSDAPSDDLAFLPGISGINFGRLPAKPNFDTVIMLECSDPQRGGDLSRVFKASDTVINIDHHITGQEYGRLNYIRPEVSSTAEIIVSLFRFMGVKPSKNEATCLYTGIATDTARFLHSNTTAQSLYAAAFLAECGADIRKINTLIFNTKSYKELKLQGRALEKMRLLHKNGLSEIMLLEKDMKSLGVNSKHVQGIVSLPVMIPSVEVSVLLREDGNTVAVNLRSKGKVDVSEIASGFGGGGHARAGGFRIEGGKIENVRKQLLSAVKKRLYWL
jgi:phosphoesterase RecJ-like protein